MAKRMLKNVDKSVRVHVNILTACSFTIITEITLHWLYSYACLFPHLVDLRHAEFGVQTEEQTTSLNAQVVLAPVPQVLQVLVVDGGERICADNRKRSREGYNYLIQINKEFFYCMQACFIQVEAVTNVVKIGFFATWWQC